MLCYVDATESETNITGDQVESEYRYLIMKITKTGTIEWYRKITGLVKTNGEKSLPRITSMLMAWL